MILKTQTGKLFSIHLDFIVNEKNLCRISISNIFKDVKVTGSSIQIPIQEIQPQKWTIIQLNVFNILDENNMFNKRSEEKKFYLRSFQICSNQFFRGIATSDIDYNVTTFPKELSLKCKRDKDWYKEYGWIGIGKSEDEVPEQEKPPKKSSKPKRPKSALRNSKGKGKKDPRSSSNKRVSFVMDNAKIMNDNKIINDQENIKDIANYQEERKSIKEMNQDHEIEDHKAIIDELDRVRDKTSLIERTKIEIEEMKRQYEIKTYGKPSEGDYSVKNNEKLLVQQHPDPNGSEDPNDVFVLRPDPIMRLNQ